MPPATQLIESHSQSPDPMECKFRKIDSNAKNEPSDEIKKVDEMSIYDIALSSIKNEPKFMKHVRDWERRAGFITPIRWINTILITLWHAVAVVGLLVNFYSGRYAKWETVLFAYFMGQVSGFGVTAGVHRFWCHRSYKARWPLKLILIVCYSVAGQNTIFDWVRDHRVHHKFSETTADPHDANRGFFFSHVGWLMMKKHPDVVREGKKLDITDVTDDPFVNFHTRHFMLFKILFCWVLPSLVPYYVWGETLAFSILTQAFVRYVMSLHFTWSVNSFAHLWGNKPYDRHIMPSENRGVSIVAMGEGWHNYHHTFPWDYKAAELGSTNNITTHILDFFARLGWAYDMKEASPTLVKAVAKSRGDQQCT